MEITIVFITLLFILISLYFEILGPAFTFVVAVAVLGVFEILTPKEILSGFANEQLAVILLLLLIGDIIRKSALVEIVFDRVFRNDRTYRGFMLKMMLLVSTFSAFLNNTPLVAIMIPYVHSWSKRNNISPSKLLIPLSYSAILGGCMTLIGTSTNLIVNGLVQDQEIIEGLPELEMFDFFAVGFPMMIIGLIYLLLFSKRLLPDRQDALGDFSSSNRDYIVQATIEKDSSLIGKNISNDDTKKLKGLYLVEIIRGDKRIPAISPQVMTEGDKLVFAGDTPTIADLITKSNTGLSFPTLNQLSKRKYAEVIEIVISHNSTIIGKTVLEANFRGRFDSAIIAIHRNGERITGRISYEKLRAGDALLIYAGHNFTSLSKDTQDFYLISRVKENRKIEPYKNYILFGGLALAIILSAFRIVPLFTSLVALLILINLLNISPPKDIAKSLDHNLALIIALSLSLGTAMMKTGVADMIADSLIALFLPLGEVGLLAGIFIITSLLANLITNKAAVALVFPISITMASNLNYPAIPFVLVVAFAAAANFMTPIGYQTNLMVYGPGGYSFRDFFRIGFPLTFLYMIVTVAVLSVIYI